MSESILVRARAGRGLEDGGLEDLPGGVDGGGTS